MVHVTCDSCGQEFHPARDPHYVVKIDAHAVESNVLLTEDDLDDDHLEEVGKLLQQIEESEALDFDEAEHKSLRYDLCSQCFQKYLKDPLGKESIHRFDFSEN